MHGQHLNMPFVRSASTLLRTWFAQIIRLNGAARPVTDWDMDGILSEAMNRYVSEWLPG